MNLIEPATELLGGAETGWCFSLDCPEHGLVYAAFRSMEKSADGYMVILAECEEGCELHLKVCASCEVAS